MTLSDNETPINYQETNGYDRHPIFPGLGTISRESSSRDCEASAYCVGVCKSQHPFTLALALHLAQISILI